MSNGKIVGYPDFFNNNLVYMYDRAALDYSPI